MSKGFQYSRESSVTMEQARTSRNIVWAGGLGGVATLIGLYAWGVIGWGWATMLVGTAVITGLGVIISLLIWLPDIVGFFEAHWDTYQQARYDGVRDE